MSSFNLTNHFLIAMPTLEDPHFSKTVTYICAHNDEGAMGIVINRPMDIHLEEVFSQMNIEADGAGLNSQAVYLGAQSTAIGGLSFTARPTNGNPRFM